MLKLTQKEKTSVGHWLAGLYTLDELKNVLWHSLKTAQELPNGCLLVECRKTGYKKTI